jgi:hypothetical protein
MLWICQWWLGYLRLENVWYQNNMNSCECQYEYLSYYMYIDLYVMNMSVLSEISDTKNNICVIYKYTNSWHEHQLITCDICHKYANGIWDI